MPVLKELLSSVRGKGAKDKAKVPIGETLNILRRYLVQETLGPLRHLGRMLGLGLAGALLIGLGAVMLVVGFLRVIQGEAGSSFSGNWSFAPYLLTVVFAVLLVGGLGALLMKRTARRDVPEN